MVCSNSGTFRISPNISVLNSYDFEDIAHERKPYCIRRPRGIHLTDSVHCSFTRMLQSPQVDITWYKSFDWNEEDRMDANRFDKLTRQLASGSSRRSVLKGLLGIGGAAAVSTVSVEHSSARRRGGSNTPTTPPPEPTTTPAPPVCNGTQCGLDCCEFDEQCCDGECCPSGFTCVGEEFCCPSELACGADCCDAESELCCDGQCIPIGTCCDSIDCDGTTTCCANGAGCGIADFDEVNQCTSNEECCSGICQSRMCVPTIAGTCSPGEYDCPPTSGCGFSCYCASSFDGNSVCIDYSSCEETCDDCPEGQICIPSPAGCCPGRGVRCAELCPPLGGGCFTGSTRIAMADGTSTPIEQISIGDSVLGSDGTPNRVLDVATPLLGDRPLYSLNGGGYFVAASHPFMTQNGWKSLDPSATTARQPELEVGLLQVGDQVRTLLGVLAPVGSGDLGVAAHSEIETEYMLIERIDKTDADPSTPLFNLRLDGDHTYFANDRMVHNK